MKKIILALCATLLCTISFAQPPMGGGGFPGGGFPGGGFPGGGFPGGMRGMMPGMMPGMDVSSYSSVDVAKAQSAALGSILDLSEKQQKQVYRVELKVADERYMDLLKQQSNSGRGGGRYRGNFGPNMNGGFPGMGGGMPGGAPGVPPEGAPENGEGGPEAAQEQQSNMTSEDMITDVELLKKYDGMRLKPFGKILTPEQKAKWEEYKAARYERAARMAERQAAAEAAAAAASAPTE